MTRAERLAKAEERARARLEVQRHRLVQVQAQQRDAERWALHKRRALIGKLVEEAGLFCLDDATLEGLFARLAPLVDAPDPVAVLDALLSDRVSPPRGSEPGCAQAMPGVAPVVPV